MSFYAKEKNCPRCKKHIDCKANYSGKCIARLMIRISDQEIARFTSPELKLITRRRKETKKNEIRFITIISDRRSVSD